MCKCLRVIRRSVKAKGPHTREVRETPRRNRWDAWGGGANEPNVERFLAGRTDGIMLFYNRSHVLLLTVRLRRLLLFLLLFHFHLSWHLFQIYKKPIRYFQFYNRNHIEWERGRERSRGEKCRKKSTKTKKKRSKKQKTSAPMKNMVYSTFAFHISSVFW